MKSKLTLVSASLAMLMTSNSWAQDAYYNIEEIKVYADGANYGPYPVAMSEDEAFIATHSMKASLSTNIDIGLPYTFNRECQYDDILCEFVFYGSESAGQLSYENAYQAWRNAQANASTGYSSYMFANTLLDGSDTAQTPFLPSDSVDVKVTDVTNEINGDRFTVGYASAPYSGQNREFVRRAYIQSIYGEVSELLPEFTEAGGFSSAYKIQEVTYKTGDPQILIIGASSVSYAKNDSDYFLDCYFSDEDDNRFNINDLVRCPGFDTQAWAWNVTDLQLGGEISGKPLATSWLSDRKNSLTFSAHAFDINKNGVAVGASTFEYSSNSEGARQRAIIMNPTDNGEYGFPVEIVAATNDIEDQDDLIYNTWALNISDAGLVTGNREYATAKGRNKATEFFVHDSINNVAKFPLKDKKVSTSQQRLENNGSYFISKSGANSQAYAANEAGWIVGEVDDYDQVDPVYGGSPRSQTAFLFDSNKNQAWLMNDLICKQIDGVVESPLYRIRSARVISDKGVVLAEGFKYDTPEDYKNKTNAIPAAFKLTPNTVGIAPDDSPNCWESSLFKEVDEPYERQGGATFWLWLLAMPVLFIRRYKR
ncbi:hypothetical protein CW745_01690 [Psychromonas sp. psych-6C06]|uniref:DUF3466 family protein n=1 Tax=Psychromonas sp. psych-6C06 TaxID=2058089 RepID=UPI000C33C0A8|nr:DUF3466 family protein [Psychromonas sp. psych-6C06]PKF63583.1 hypothetical protein CW745_01690 [Psychromonas sp. psych-6C06]